MKQLLLIGCVLVGAYAAFGKDETAPAAPKMTATQASEGDGFSGKVLETMNAAGYTYVLVDTGTRKAWAAAPQFEVKVGDQVVIGEGLPMRKHHSKTLNRDFELILFSGSATLQGAAAKTPQLPAGHPAIANGALPKNHPPVGGATAKPTVEVKGIKKADGGQTVSEIFTGKAKFSGKPVAVRGKVVKYNAQIMGKNWLHIQDGTGSEGSNDLVVTTATACKLGDTVLVKGTLSTDKDFGAGYKFAAILDDAKVVVE